MKLLSNTPSKHFGSSFIPEDVLWDCLSIFSFFFIPVWMPFHRVTFLTSPSFSIVPSLFFMSGPPFIPFFFLSEKNKNNAPHRCVCVCVRTCVCVCWRWACVWEEEASFGGSRCSSFGVSALLIFLRSIQPAGRPSSFLMGKRATG